MNDLSGPIIVEENETHFLVGIHYNDRHLAREINGRAWDGEKRRWAWKKNLENYKNLSEAFREIAKCFEISDKNLTKENPKGESKSITNEDPQTEDNWEFHRTKNLSWFQIEQLQRMEGKIDELLEKRVNAEIIGINEEKNHESSEISDRRHGTNGATLPQVQEIIAALTSDETFNELILRKEAHQSSIQRVHNKIRDEIRNFKTVQDEEIHKILENRFAKKNGMYRKGVLNLVQLTWFAQEEGFYTSGTNGEPDIYQMLHLFNSTRVAVEKYDQNNEEMSRIHAVLCLSLGRIIWSRIRVSSMEEYEAKDKSQELREI
jgi:hypothetical protein